MERTLEQALKYSASGHEFIWSLLTGTDIPSSPRNDLVAAYVAIMLEHQDAITNLIKLNLKGSALALLRSQLEAGFRGLWVNLIASDIQVNCIGQHGDEPFPRFKEFAKQLDVAYGAEGWLEDFIKFWGAMNGYTHSGLEQLGRRFRSDGHISPTYPEGMIAELATVSCTISVGILVPILRHIHFNDKAQALEEWLAANSQVGENISPPEKTGEDFERTK